MRCLLPLVALTFCVTVVPAWAQEHEEPARGVESTAELHGDDEHGPQYDLLSIDGLTAVWTIVVFIILLIVLRATAWKPIQQVLVKREKFIAQSLEEAKREREEAEAVHAKYTEQIKAARDEAAAIIDEGRRGGETARRKIEEDARREAEAILERAKREIGIASDSAVRNLYELSGKLATDIAARIIRKELDAREHERLIAESIEELGKVARDDRSS